MQSRNPLLSDRQGFDRRWHAPNVQLVYAPTTAQELAAALAEAEVRFGAAGTVKVVSGRHCYERFVYDATTRAIVDVSLLRGIGYDPGDGFWIDTPNEPHLDWIRQFYRDMYVSTGGVPEPTEVMDGCYYNYPDTDLGEYANRERALQLYFKDNLRLSNPNLVDVKTYWDGGNFFQHPQSIPPRA